MDIFADLDKDMGKEWKVGDRASSRWFLLRIKISKYQGMSDLSQDPPTGNFLATLVIKYWMMHMPTRIANLFERHMYQTPGYWNDVMERIDHDLESLLKDNPTHKRAESSKARRKKRREGPKCDWCSKFGHIEEECRTKTWQVEKIMTLLNKTPSGPEK